VSSAAATLGLLLSFGLLFARSGGPAIAICAAQAACAAVALGSPPALLVLAFNGVALPLAMWRLAAVPVPRQPSLLWLLVLILATLPVIVLAGVSDIVALGIAVTLLGLLMAVRGSALLGLVSAHNGLVLAAGAVPDLPMAELLVVTLPVVPAMNLAHAWRRR
jgi:hypothetical protein